MRPYCGLASARLATIRMLAFGLQRYCRCGSQRSRRLIVVQRGDSQKDGGLVLLLAPQPCPHSARKLFCGAHGAPLLSAIGTLGGRCICINGYVALRRQRGNGEMTVKTRGNMCRDIGVAHGMGGQCREILLSSRRGRHVVRDGLPAPGGERRRIRGWWAS